MAKLKKYEISIDGLTIDFRKALSSTYEYNEHFSNAFSNLVYIIALPAASKHMKKVHAETEEELYCRVNNYMRAKGYDAHMRNAFGEALVAKVKSYRKVS